MLNKEICKRCYNETFEDHPWVDDDDDEWSKGNICDCPELNLLKTSDQPPKHCKYQFEHVVMSQKSVNDVE